MSIIKTKTFRTWTIPIQSPILSQSIAEISQLTSVALNMYPLGFGYYIMPVTSTIHMTYHFSQPLLIHNPEEVVMNAYNQTSLAALAVFVW